MKKLKSALILVMVILNCQTMFGQISVTGGLTAQQLAEILAGTNITVSNATITGPALGYGSFTSSNGFICSSGVILSNGMISNAVGPNNDPNTSDNLGGAGTQQMTDLGGAGSSDVVTLEFDFVVQSAGVQFSYLFASEDYPEFAPPNQPTFNDVFAFYISGPGITGEENIALIPSTSLPVTIANVNPVTNSQYYWDNTGGTEIQFDGGTVELVAQRSGLTPCQTYHLKLVIADIHNANRNSAVFLKENSFVQENVLGAETQTINADGIALEGCVQGSFAFQFSEVSDQDRFINFTIGGTAVNGVDYAYIDNSITIPAGETSGTVYIDAFSDGLTEGPETITITYNSGVCVGTETVTLTINDAQPINFTLDGTNLDCFGDNSGEILVNATGGFPAYTYHVTDPSGATTNYTSNPITGLAAGEYSVQVYDTYGCKAEALVIGGQFNAGVTFLPDGSGVTYQAPLTISGFNPGQTITSVDQIQQICLTMEHSYLGDLWIRVQSPSGAVVTLKQQNGGASCDLGEPIATGPVDGAGSSDITPGTGYEYCFNANPVYNTMVNESMNFTRNYTDAVGNSYTDNYLPAGSYTADGNFSTLIGSPMNGTWSVYVTDQFGLDNGYIFNWYISLVGDMPDTTIVLTQPQEITVSGLATNATCGSSNGSVNVSVLNGVAPMIYLWSNGATSEDLSNVPAGQYTLTATDANGCSVSQTFLVNNTGTLAISTNISNVSCFGGSNGSIDATVSGGTTPYNYSWSNGPTTQDVSGLSAGSYTLTVTDNIGCILSQVINVSQNSQIIPVLVSSSDEICNTNNGALDVSVNGGNGSYGYLWSNGATSEDISALNSGSYTLNITDGLGCTGTGTFTITNNLTGCANYCYTNVTQNQMSNATCGNSNGSIDITIQNAVAPYTVNWNNGATTEDINGLSAGTYSVSIVDANNCSANASFTILNNTGNLSISSTMIQDETCGNNNGSIDISVNGGVSPLTYLWSNNATTQDIQNIAAGTYSLAITDNSGCVLNQSFTVLNNTGGLSVSGDVSASFCNLNNGAITQTVSASNGTVSYQWSNGATTQSISGLSPGTYTCTYTDGSGCSGSSTYTVTQNNSSIALTGTLVTNETCNNNQGAINITVSGNSLTYSWSNGATTEDISGLSSGNYSCTISNSQGCSLSTGTIVVISNAGNMTVTNQAVTNSTCGSNNGSIDVNINNGTAPFNYLWSNGSSTQDISGLAPGIYTLQVSDANGCAIAHSVTVGNSPGTLAISNAVLTHEACVSGNGTNGQGTINITVTGGTTPYTYLWSNGATTQDLTSLSDGQYSVVVNSANGCSLTQTYTILANGSNIAITSSSIADETCGANNGAIAVTMEANSGPYSYSWSNGQTTEDLQGLSTGTYDLTVSNIYGCQLTQSFTVNNDPGTLVVSGSVTNETCGNQNGAINVTINGGSTPYSYLWSNGSSTQDLSNISAGNYNIIVTDIYGCYENYSATVNNIANGLTATITTVTNDACGQGIGAINASTTGAVSFSWSNGATTEDISNLAAGTYTLTVSDALGCSTSASAVVQNQTGALAIGFSNVQNETCSNGQGFIDIEVSGTGPFTYNWSNSATSQDIINLVSGNYTVTITDGSGCQLSQSFNVGNTNASPTMISSLVTDAFCTAANGAIDVTVTSGIAPFSYSWNNGATTQDLSNLASGNYNITITDGVNCQSTQTIYVGTQFSDLHYNYLELFNDFCNSGQGQIIFHTNGTADYFYIDGVDIGGQQSGPLFAGTYLLTIADIYGCSIDSTVVLGNDAFFNLSSTQVNTTCGQSNGSINLSVTGGGGGGGNYTYLWSNGATTQDLNNIPAGTYTVTVSTPGGPGGGCSDQLTVTITNDNGFTVSSSINSDYCGQGIGGIDQTIVNGSGMTFLWSNGAATEDLSNVSFGDYICTVSESGGCSVDFPYTIGNQTNGTVVNTQVQNEVCGDAAGSIDLILTGGSGTFDFAWSNSAIIEDLTGLSAGTYTVTITDQNDGCVFTASSDVMNTLTVFDGSGLVTNATCATCTDGAINIALLWNTTYTYLWSNGATTQDVSGLTPGTYSVTVTSAEGCDTTMTFNVLNTATIEEIEIAELEMNVYPNPASDDFNVDLVLPEGVKAQLTITDIMGKLVMVRDVDKSGITQFNTLNMEPGVYFVTCWVGNQTYMERLVVQSK